MAESINTQMEAKSAALIDLCLLQLDISIAMVKELLQEMRPGKRLFCGPDRRPRSAKRKEKYGRFLFRMLQLEAAQVQKHLFAGPPLRDFDFPDGVCRAWIDPRDVSAIDIDLTALRHLSA